MSIRSTGPETPTSNTSYAWILSTPAVVVLTAGRREAWAFLSIQVTYSCVHHSSTGYARGPNRKYKWLYFYWWWLDILYDVDYIELRRLQPLYTTLLPIYATHLPIEIQTNEKYTDHDTDTRSRSKNNQSWLQSKNIHIFQKTIDFPLTGNEACDSESDCKVQ